MSAELVAEVAEILEDGLRRETRVELARRLGQLIRWLRRETADREYGATVVADARDLITEVTGRSYRKRSDARLQALELRLAGSRELYEMVAVLVRLRADLSGTERPPFLWENWPNVVRTAFESPQVMAHLGAESGRPLRKKLRHSKTLGPAYRSRTILGALVGAPHSWVRDLGRAPVRKKASGTPPCSDAFAAELDEILRAADLDDAAE
jgi:hypothetical protein